ncbi:MAG TPA: hypothetical protein VGM79_31640 [Streptosporangiaceae bacterium]|jgi:hypothetical protein
MASAVRPAPGLFVALALAVPRGVRAAAPSLDAGLVRRWPRLAPLTFAAAARS